MLDSQTGTVNDDEQGGREVTQAAVKGAHLVGSVPYESASAVFKAASGILGEHLHRIPDGEVGERSNWVAWQLPMFLGSDAFEWTEQDSGYSEAAPRRLRIKEGHGESEIRFENIGYADVAIESFALFDALQKKGEVSRGHRFQVCLPTPVAPIHLWVRTEDQHAVEKEYEAAMLNELARIADSIPAEQLAIQWDTAVEFGILEGCFPTYMQSPMAEVMERLLRLGDAVPMPVQLGYHLCYGDAGHKHFVEPADMSKLVAVANALAQGLKRPLNWIHLPVPKDRSDDAYFAPAGDLKLAADTELYLGLIHSDGEAAANERVAATLRHIPAFGVATECGFGRRDPETIRDLMAQHASVSSPVNPR